MPPFHEDGGDFGDGCDDGEGEERDGGEFSEGEGGLEEDDSSESEDPDSPDELGDGGGGLDSPFEFGGDFELELEPGDGGAPLELDLSLSLSSPDDEELGDGAIFDMISLPGAPPLLVDQSLWPSRQLRKTSSNLSWQ